MMDGTIHWINHYSLDNSIDFERTYLVDSDLFRGWIACTIQALNNWVQGSVSRKSRELFGPEKPFVKVRPAYSVKLVFSYVVKGIKIKITAKFRASGRFRFEDTKRIMSPEIRPKSFGTFEKGPRTGHKCL